MLTSIALTNKFEASCVSCRLTQDIEAFEVVAEGPPKRFHDFCADCIREHGVENLYQRFGAETNPQVRALVLGAAARLVKPVLTDLPAGKPAESQAAIAQRELAARELARRMLMSYVLRFFPAYHPGWVHHDIARRLEKFVRDVEEKKSPRLILTMPPRHGKSTLVSDMFPSWVLGQHPEWEIISASYGVALPLNFSRTIRDRLRSPMYEAIFEKTKIRDDNGGAEQWKTTEGGGYRAAGVGGGITGMGAHILIVDDPLKDAAEAQSDTIRANVKSWFNTAAYNRLAPGGGVLIVQTRWHDDDLAGSCMTLMREQIEQDLPPEEIDMWELVNYPAIATSDEYLLPDGSIGYDFEEGARLLRHKGEALHPERYDLQKLMRIKNRYSPAEWNALYQQDPVPDDGAFFSRDMMRFYPYLAGTRAEYTFFTAWDVAIGEKKRNDFTVGITMAINERNELYLVDMVRGRFSTMEIVQHVCDQIQKWDCSVFGMEHGQIKMTLWPLILEEMRRRNLSCSINDDLKPIQDKETRATPLRGLMQQGRVFFPMSATNPWIERVIGEMLRFPAGTHDDIVDALAWAARMSRTAPRPQVTQLQERAKQKSWRDELDSWPGIRPGAAAARSYMSN